jgi:hypothetical protein
MMAQFGPGKPRLGRSSGDDARQRRQWFWQCLGRIESRKPRIKQLAFPEKIGCGLAGGDWSTYKEMIRTFARRNRDIQVDIIQLLGDDDSYSEADSSDPSDWTDQDPTPDPHDDNQDHEEEQDPDVDAEDEHNHEGNHSGREHNEPHDPPAEWEACSTSSDETGSEWGHDDSTDSVCSNEKLRSALKRERHTNRLRSPSMHISEKITL